MSSTSDDAPPERDLVSRAVAVLPHLLLLAILATLAYVASLPLQNPDTFFHLRFGHEFLTGWSLRHPGSVTSFATRDWLPTQWSTQMAMATMEDWFGLAGVAWWAGLQFVGFAVAVYVACRREASALIAAPVTVLVIAASAQGLSARPQVISYALVAVVTSAWLMTGRDGRVRWWLIPVAWVWATAHGMWPVGILIGVAGVAGLWLDGRVERRTVAKAALVPLGSALASALTPVGPALYGAVLAVGDRAHYFSEWAPPDYTGSPAIVLAAMLLLLLLIRLRRPASGWTETLLLVSAVGWALYSTRTVPVAATMVGPLLAAAVQTLTEPRVPPGRGERWLLAGGAAGVLAALALVLTLDPHRVDPVQPAWIDPILRSQPSGTVVLDDSAWGGYLMWAYPQLELMRHGYGDTFTDAELEREADLVGLRDGWEEIVTDSGARLAILETDDPLAYALQRQQHWTVLGEDEDLTILAAPPG